ncbi:hypothetical protein [Pseudoduganella danionis]|uniref:hypothetical protein n=1 Tax=Pseudoduganella danionis TaxID=1890295 RepID=UPI0035B34B0B
MRSAPVACVRRQSASGSVLVLLLVVILGLSVILMRVFSPGKRLYQHDLQTRQQLAVARDALQGFAVSHGRLPRPARSALDGRERPDDCGSDADCSGMLPWVSLGITPLDGWGHLLYYSVTPEMTLAQVSRNVIPDKVVLQQDMDGNVRYLVGQDSCSQALLCSPAVVFSSGPAGGISLAGLQQLGNTDMSAVARSNLAATQRFFLPGSVTATGQPDGAQLRWLDAAWLLRRMDDARQLH